MTLRTMFSRPQGESPVLIARIAGAKWFYGRKGSFGYLRGVGRDAVPSAARWMVSWGLHLRIIIRILHIHIPVRVFINGICLTLWLVSASWCVGGKELCSAELDSNDIQCLADAETKEG
jgi:hypothetical protein